MMSRDAQRWRLLTAAMALALAPILLTPPAGSAQGDPSEPPGGKPSVALLPRPAAAITQQSVSEASIRETIEQLVSCGTRHSLSSWNDPARGIGCARNKIVASFKRIAQDNEGRLQVVVDSFEAASARTHDRPVHLENVLAILPGSDPLRAKTAFVISGHYDSRASDVMNPELDAPGADDDASGVAVSLEAARLLAGGSYRATLVFAAVSGEEQGLLGGTRLLEYLHFHGYQIGGMLDNDIVGADIAPGGPHRVRVFSASPCGEGCDAPSRELARAVEEIVGENSVRLIFRLDRMGRGGDHRPFVEAGAPAVRFTEPLEDYRHEHQTLRVENGVEYGDLPKFLNFSFIANVARINAEVLQRLAQAPGPPEKVVLGGAVTPDARLSWTAEKDPERAGFEILWRETTNPRWSVYDFVASAGETVLAGVSTDNHFFAVRSVGKDGSRSIARAAEPASTAQMAR
jgi:hypothetical protein